MRQFVNTQVFDAADGGSAQTSRAIPIGQFRTLSFTAVMAGATGTIDGSVKVQVANSPANNTANPDTFIGDWIDLPSATDAFSTNETIQVIADVCYQWARLVYAENTQTDGSLSAYLHGN